MTSLSVLVPEVRTHLAGAPEPQVLLYLRRAARQFCQDSRVWTISMGTARVDAQVDDSPTLIGLPNSDLTIPEGAAINTIDRAERPDALTAAARPELIAVEWDYVTGQMVIPPRSLLSAADVEVFAVLEPTTGTSDIPDFIAQRWPEAIVDYATFKMMLMPSQEWSNRNLATDFLMEYRKRLAEATVDRARRGTQRPVRVPPTPFA